MQEQNGFTLIEIVIVVAIVSALAGIVLFNISDYIQKAQNVAIIETVTNMGKAGRIYFVANSSYVGFTATPGPGDPEYLKLMDAYLKLYPGHNPTERETTNTFCVCYDMKGEIGANKHTLCLDSLGYVKEMNYDKDCGWRCQVSGICRD